MKSKSVVFLRELAEELGMSQPNVRRLHAKTRRGEPGGIPLAISEPGSKCRWLRSDIEQYLAERSQAAEPVSPVSPAKQRRQQDKDYTQRQETAKRVLAKHGLGADRSKTTTKRTAGRSGNRANQTQTSTSKGEHQS